MEKETVEKEKTQQKQKEEMERRKIKVLVLLDCYWLKSLDNSSLNHLIKI